MTRIRWALALTCVLLATPATAQIGQGRLTGIVTDAQGAVLPGVTVTATSPSLIGTQTAVTEADGRYRFPALPSGVYKLRFELAGFSTVERENLQVVLGQTISVDNQLKIASLAETVTVTGESPVVDVTTTKVGTSLKGDELIAIPNSTDVWGALSEAPGIRMQGFDVGGSHKSQQSGYEVFGVQNQARVVTEGIDHTEGVGGTGFYEDYYANEEYSISALGSDVEMNSGGAAIVATSKSGGNEFSGMYHLSYQPGEWVGDNNNDELRSHGFTGNPNLLFWEGHADLGGRIVKDKVWFFAAYNHFKIDKVVSGVSQDIATDIGIFDNYTGKGTWKAGTNNTVIGYYQAGHKQKPKRGLSSLRPPESIQAQDSWSKMYKGEFQRVLSNRAFFDATVANFTLDWPMVPAVDFASRPPQVFRDTGAVAGAGWNSFTTGRKKPQVKAQFTYFLPKAGSQDFKFGFESIYDWYRFGINGSNGPIRYSYPTQGAAADRIRFADTGTNSDFEGTWRSGPNTDQHYAFYLQDRWTTGARLSITAGVRFDYQRVGYEDSTRVPEIADVLPNGTRIFPQQSTVEGATLVTNTDIAPRLGLSYDVTGQGKTVFKAFYGRYYNNLADGFSSANPGGTNYAEYNFTDLNGNGRYDNPLELGAERLRIGGVSTTVDPELETPYTDEISASFEHQFWGESSARMTYVRKMQRKFVPFYYTPFVPAWHDQLTVPVRVVTEDGEAFNLRDIPASIAGDSAAQFANIPDGDFNYDTIEFAFNKRYGSRFFMQSSVDFQWRDELRSPDLDNWGNTTPLATDPLGVNYFLNPNPAVPNRQETTMYHLTMMGRYVFPHDIGVAGNYRFQSGFPYSRIIPDATTTPTLNATPVPFFVENLDQNRSDNVHLLNFRIDKGFTIGKIKLTGMFDLYNVLNANPVTNFNLYNGGFGDIIAVLDPRVAQVGFRLEF